MTLRVGDRVRWERGEGVVVKNPLASTVPGMITVEDKDGLWHYLDPKELEAIDGDEGEEAGA